jgi:NAD(P)-dependent dehydrogenase (short-subunit alcohol dehydrogenase family)
MTSSRDLPPLVEGYITSVIKHQFLAKLSKPPKGTNLSDQVAIVTGASSGLGCESARQLLRLGVAHLIIAVRSLKRGRDAANELQSANPRAKIEVWELEMESYQSIEAFIHKCETELPPIDIIILNSGLAEVDFNLSPSTGHERMMQVNYFSTILLAVLFLRVLKAKPSKRGPSRITVVNSMMSAFAKLPTRHEKPLLSSFDHTKTAKWDPQNRYNDSKLLGQLFINRLADIVNPDEVVINLVEPGLTKGTSLFRNIDGLMGLAFGLFKASAARPVATAALTYIDATVVKGKESHGSFLVDCKIFP